MATVQLAVADDAFGLRADVDEHLVLVDADDRALDDIAVLEAPDVGFLLGEQLLHRRRLGAQVARRRRGLGFGCGLGLGRSLGLGCGHGLGLCGGLGGGAGVCLGLGGGGLRRGRGLRLGSRLAVDDGCLCRR